MKFLNLPGRLQIAINKALAELEEDVFAETVERDGEMLIVEVSGPGNDSIIAHKLLRFDHETETYRATAAEPTMQKCPYCQSSHYDIAACPLNPNRR